MDYNKDMSFSEVLITLLLVAFMVYFEQTIWVMFACGCIFAWQLWKMLFRPISFDIYIDDE